MCQCRAPRKWSHVKNTVGFTILTFRHIQCLHLMYAEVAWVLVSSGTQAQPQIMVDPDYLPDCLSVSYDYALSKQNRNRNMILCNHKDYTKPFLNRTSLLWWTLSCSFGLIKYFPYPFIIEWGSLAIKNQLKLWLLLRC